MYALLAILLAALIGMAQAEDAVNERVVEGELHKQSLLQIGGSMSFVRLTDSDDRFGTWLSVCRDLEHGDAVRTACVAALRTLTPPPSVLVSPFRAAGAELSASDGAWLLAVGTNVPPTVVQTVLRVVRQQHTGPLVLRGWNDADAIISVGPAPGAARPADASTIAQLLGPLDESTMRTLLGRRPSPPPTMPALVLVGAPNSPLVDLDLRSGDGKPAVPSSVLRCEGVTWTAEGVFLPGHRLTRYPPHFPSKDELAPIPQAAYIADVILPDMVERAVTITLLLCQASNELERDNLFSLGRRSRWLSAQVGRAGEVLVGLDSRWLVIPALTENKRSLIISPRSWHAVTIAAGDHGRLLRVVIDGQVAKDAIRDDNNSQVPPRPVVDNAGENVLSFVDPGNPRHLHGLVQRVIVHRGLLDHAAIIALHVALNPAALPPPTSPAFATPLSGTGQTSDEMPKAVPENVNDF